MLFTHNPPFDSVARLGDELAARWETPVDVVDLDEFARRIASLVT